MAWRNNPFSNQPHQVLHHIEDTHAAIDYFDEGASHETDERAEGRAPSQFVRRLVDLFADIGSEKRSRQHYDEADGEKQRYQKA